MAFFVAIEGIDGSGKGTQTAAVAAHFRQRGLRTETITFPRYSETRLGKQIGRFLDGQFGPLEHLHPVPISLMYAVERFESSGLIRDKLANSDLLIADRYTGSNLAHQGARLQGSERGEFLKFIGELEADVFQIPTPDLIILLDLPAAASAARVARKKARDYTENVTDLQESNLGYLEAVREVYLELCLTSDAWQRVDCLQHGIDRPIEEIQQQLIALVDEHFSSTI